ncbi:MAG: ATP-dependent zinc metalloprotease FtsH [Deltaproteobacteria bacterium]
MAETRKKNTSNPQQPGVAGWRFWAAIAASWLIVSLFFSFFRGPETTRLSYNEFKQAIETGRITKISIKKETVTGKMEPPPAKKGEEKAGEKASSATGKQEKIPFVTVLPPFNDRELLPMLEKKGVVIDVESSEQSWVTTLLISLLPWVLIIGIFVYTSKKMRERMGGGGGLFNFARSKAKLYRETESDVRLDDVAGLDNAKKEVEEIIGFLREPGKYQTLGGKMPKGILLAGPPGTGKTLLARAVAGEAEVPFFSISGSEFIEMFVGVGASRVRDMFEKAKKDAPAIIFIDEIDAIGRVRGTGLGGGHDEREQTLNQILTEMDGFSPRHSVIVMAATNRPDVLDPALIRPGRFDRQIFLELPHREARRKILEIHTRNMPLAADVDLELVARRTVGFSGADLENLANEAALLGARRDEKAITLNDFDDSVDKILLGVEREELINKEDRRVVAYHESGHAMMARLLPGADPLKKVSIIPRGRALGVTEQLPEEDRLNVSRTYLINRIGILLGGRVAEQIVFGDITSGAGDDLKKATSLARKMVCQLGMSEKLGPVVFKQGEEHPFLGMEITQSKDFSEATAQLIDEEVRNMMEQMQGKAHDLLAAHQKDLKLLAEQLLEHESLTNKEIDELFGEGEVQNGGPQEQQIKVQPQK